MRRNLLIATSILFTLCLPVSTLAQQTSQGNSSLNLITKTQPKSTLPTQDDCTLPIVDKAVYSAQLVSIDVPGHVAKNQLFESSLKYKNTGNQPWFSIESTCPGQASTFLGTTRQQDRSSVFFAPASFGETKWFQANRIKMSKHRVNPGEVAEFKFIGHAPDQDGLFREYFAPVIEGTAWLNQDSEATFDIKVGEPAEDESILQFTRELDSSINLVDPIFLGEKKIVVSLSQQRMWLKIGDNVIKTYRVSTGKPKTPTPRGTTKIMVKQEVRVAASSPHYIMPKFMMFRKGGYGIHALPSLANDRGVFWREALSHIGSARSHGCIRLLPEDAEYAFKFADVGTTVQVF